MRISSLARSAREYAPLIFQIGSILFLLFSIYLTSRLAPLAESIRLDGVRIKALEDVHIKNESYVERYVTTEQKVKTLEEQNKEIKESLIRMETKIDRLIERRQI